MNLYGLNSTLFDLGFSDDALIESISSSHAMLTNRRYGEREEENLLKLSNSMLKSIKRNSSPPKHRHDGTSPLPLGMDWSPPPRNWDGKTTIWPHGFHTGWSYCVTIPSWSIFAESRGSEPVVFYRVQIGLQSPEGVTTTHGVLKRFSDFLKLSSDLKHCFRKKKLPSTPPKGLLRMKDRTLIEERRCSLEDWMEKILSDIDLSRSAPVACFLELEAAARSAFHESSHHIPNVNLSCNSSSSSDLLASQTDVSVVAGISAISSNYDNGSLYQTSDAQPEFNEGMEEQLLKKCLDGGTNLDQIHMGPSSDSIENSPCLEISPVSHTTGLLRGSPPKGTISAIPCEISTSREVHQDSAALSQCSESVGTSEAIKMHGISDLQFSHDTRVVLPLDEQQKVNRILSTVQQQLVTSRTDIEDLIARLNQELTVRQYLTTKVNDLETELKSTKQIGKENLEQAINIERERFTQMQWDMEELRRKCMETEFRLKTEQDEKACVEATKTSILKENEELRQELDSTREQLKNLQKCQEEADMKSKSDVKLLVREVKALRGSQSELQKELNRVSKERMEFETRLQKEKTIRECVDAGNIKLLRECEIIRGRLEECSVNFMGEQENKLKMEFPADILDILATSDNRIGLLLAEAQLLAKYVSSSSDESEDWMRKENELRKMVINVLIDNAILRKQANSLIHCALNNASL